MNTNRGYRVFVLLSLVLLMGAHPSQAQQNPANALDTAQIEKLTGLKGKMNQEENVFKVSQPRSDLKVNVAGVKTIPALGFTSWAAFKPAVDHVMVMGDMVLQEQQVAPVMSVALDNGLEVTALHNHFLWDTPKVMFMHIGGSGDVEKLAAAVGKLFDKIQATAGGKPQAPNTPFDAAKTSLDPKAIEAVLGVPVEKTGDLCKATIGLTTKMEGLEIGKEMGVNTWAAFAGSPQKAVVDGDFAVLEPDLQGVLKVLRGAGIYITAIHSHMILESPRILFLHYWGAGPVEDLAKAVKAALSAQAKG